MQKYLENVTNVHFATKPNATKFKTALRPRSFTSEQMQQYLGNTVNVLSSTTSNATELKTTYIHVQEYNNAIEPISIGTIHPEDICTVYQERYVKEDHAIQVKGCGHLSPPVSITVGSRARKELVSELPCAVSLDTGTGAGAEEVLCDGSQRMC
jgi:hypothetical protein